MNETEQLKAQLAETRQHAQSVADMLQKEVDAVRRERDELRRWKAEMLQVEAEWDEQSLAKLLGGLPGRSCRKVIAERVPELVAQLQESQAREAVFKDKLQAETLRTCVHHNDMERLASRSECPVCIWRQSQCVAQIVSALNGIAVFSEEADRLNPSATMFTVGDMARSALTAPAPKVYHEEDVRKLLDALSREIEHCPGCQGAGERSPFGEIPQPCSRCKDSRHTLAAFRAKHPLPAPSEAAKAPDFASSLMGTWEKNANGCGCRACNPRAAWFVVCDTCGNKRCPHATDHALECTNSNEPGQAGSVFKVNEAHDAEA